MDEMTEQVVKNANAYKDSKVGPVSGHDEGALDVVTRTMASATDEGHARVVELLGCKQKAGKTA
jgi:hypothetical protein